MHYSRNNGGDQIPGEKVKVNIICSFIIHDIHSKLSRKKAILKRLWPGYFRGVYGLISSSPRAVEIKSSRVDLE